MPTESSLFRRLSLRGKLLAYLGLFCLLIGSLALLANWCLATVGDISARTLKVSVRLADLAGIVAELTLQCRRYEKDIFLSLLDPMALDDSKRNWRHAFDQLQKAIADFAAQAVSEEDQTAAAKWRSDSAAYRQALLAVIDRIDAGKIETPQQADDLMAPSKDSIRDLTMTATNVSRQKMVEVGRVENDLTAIIAFFRTLILIVVGIALVGSCVLGYRLVNDLTAPITALREAARRIEEGQWFARVDLQRSDELGQLADSFNRMMMRVRERAQVTMRRKIQPGELPDDLSGEREGK
jgi:nitrogen fixation/metabolism regulation signal transduction histidine kinase